MGIADSSYLVRQYMKLRNNATTRLNAATKQLTHLGKEKDQCQKTLNCNFQANKMTISQRFDSNYSALNAEYSALLSSGKTNEASQIYQQMEIVKQQKHMALQGLESEKMTTENQAAAYWDNYETQISQEKETAGQQKDLYDGALAQAKKEYAEACKEFAGGSSSSNA